MRRGGRLRSAALFASPRSALFRRTDLSVRPVDSVLRSRQHPRNDNGEKSMPRNALARAVSALMLAAAALPVAAQPEGDVAGQGQPEVVRPLVPLSPERLENMVPKHPG